MQIGSTGFEAILLKYKLLCTGICFQKVRRRAMDHRLIQPASRDQIVAIIRQRAERANRDLQPHLGQVSMRRVVASSVPIASFCSAKYSW